MQTRVPERSTVGSKTDGVVTKFIPAPIARLTALRAAIERGDALTLIQRSTPDGYIWVSRYSPLLDDALRTIVRDERATESQRVWALGILTSWRIKLDPAIYPFVAQAMAVRA